MAKSLAFWFRRKHNLAPTDPRFLEATREQIETEYWAHWYADNPAKIEDSDDDFDKAAELARIEAEGDAEDLAAAQVTDWEEL